MSPLVAVLLAALVLVLKRALELVLEKEYATWAPALARLLVAAAGFVCWPRRAQWRADLRYMQQVEGESGLLPAGWCLLSAPWLALRHLVSAFGRRGRRTAPPVDPADLSGDIRQAFIERVWSQRTVNDLERSLRYAAEMDIGVRSAPELVELP
jgi:hypothetical protein